MEDDLTDPRDGELNRAGLVFSFPEQTIFNPAEEPVHDITVIEQDEVVTDRIRFRSLGLPRDYLVLGEAAIYEDASATDDNFGE